MIRVLFICHGNICRSTMAESVFTNLINKEGLKDYFEIDSAATSREEIGNGVHYGVVRKLGMEGVPVVPHKARQVRVDDFEYFDYIIGMDSANMRNMARIAGNSDKQYKMMSFASYDKYHRLTEGRDVADPWYTGDFDVTYDDIIIGTKGFLEYLIDNHNIL